MHLTVGCTGLKPVRINGFKALGNHAILFCDDCMNRKEDFIKMSKLNKVSQELSEKLESLDNVETAIQQRVDQALDNYEQKKL